MRLPSGSRNPRVLVIAEAANPEWVSVPLVGWSLSQALREVADVHLVTQVRNREAILRAGLEEGKDFTAIDSEAVARPLHWLAGILRMGKGRGWTMNTAMASLSYPYFERLVWQRFGAELRAGKWDLVHRVTPLSPTASSPIARKCSKAGVPFVVGPLNGGVPWPPGFGAERRREREWLSYVRGLYRLAPGRHRMLDSTAAILAGSRHTESEFPAAIRSKCVYLPENAIDPHRFNRVATQDISSPLQAVFVGRLVPYKCPDIAIEAAADLLRAGHITLDIVGEGPMRQVLTALVARNGLDGAVTFHGQVPHTEVQNVLSAANILLFPSIREFGGGVVLEAMALGVVPMIVDYAGPGELVVPGCGYKVSLGRREEIIASLRAELEALVRDPSALPEAGRLAHQRAHDLFTWSAKARQIALVYDWVLGRASEKPDPLAAAVAGDSAHNPATVP